jgi:hypothetical protein
LLLHVSALSRPRTKWISFTTVPRS